MARPARIQYEGAFYHVMNRGNMRAEIFVDHEDRNNFYEILGNIEQKYGINIYVFVLMNNHYHLLLETPFSNLSQAMQSLNSNYALYFNGRRNRPGHLFQGRFKAMLVEKEHYLLELSRYIYLNPVRAGLVKNPKRYKWCSLPIYLGDDIELPFTVHWQWILSMFGRNRAEATRLYYDFIMEGVSEIKNPGLEAKGGWILGRKKWVERVVRKWLDNPSEELSGIKPLKSRIPIGEVEKNVCREFSVKRSELSDVTYNNLSRLLITYIAVNYCGFTIKDALERYGGSNYYALAKAINRFNKRIEKDKELNERINRILSIVKM
jgi:REP element-mobilizing transposase RayT